MLGKGFNISTVAAEDECRSFGDLVGNKARNYSSRARNPVPHAIKIIFSADQGKFRQRYTQYEALTSSSCLPRPADNSSPCTQASTFTTHSSADSEDF
jgi:hypothetical protein